MFCPAIKSDKEGWQHGDVLTAIHSSLGYVNINCFLDNTGNWIVSMSTPLNNNKQPPDAAHQAEFPLIQ